MTKEKRGTKRLCESCGKKFYDLGKDPEACPLCEAPFIDEKAKVKPAAKTPAKEPEEAKPAEAEEDDSKAKDKADSGSEPEFVSLDEAAAEEGSDDDDDVDLSVLGDDDDDDIPDDDNEDVFLEDDDDESGPGVEGIIGGSIDHKDEG